MNTREQLLQRGIEHLKAQLVNAQAQVDTMIDLLELQGSIACGFAWDIVFDAIELRSWSHFQMYEHCLPRLLELEERSRTKARAIMEEVVQ